jgi:tetratricopeptide (TPR) repeat protein
LPAHLLPLGVNCFSAACAALTLALLARSVALLPHDRTEEQRTRERSLGALLSIPAAWLPPLLAAVLSGFELTFWENATAASGEILNLLLFAYIVRCLLEFRLDGRDSWLLRAALVYGAAMSNNWAMAGFFPIFIGALIWIKGLSFFNVRFLGPMFLVGLAGLSLYLLMPLADSISTGGVVGFWPALRANLANQKALVFEFVVNPRLLLRGEKPLWVLALPSLLPVLALAIKWPSYFGDPSKLGVTLATLIFNVLYAVLFAVCFWVALDPQFSPRHYWGAGLQDYGILLLPFYFLGALSAGYFAGYFLLVLGTRPFGRPRPVAPYVSFVNRACVVMLWVFVLVGVSLLLCRNVPQIRLTNGPLLKGYARAIADPLPSQGAIVLSDDPNKLLLAQAALGQSGRAGSCVFLDTASLEVPEYHAFLRKKYPGVWQNTPAKDRNVYPSELVRMIYTLAKTNSVYYLHPSFGYYFESFYAEAHGLVYRLQLYPPNSPFLPPLTPEVIKENEAFWLRVEDTALKPIAAALQRADTTAPLGFMDRLAQRLHLPKEPNRDAGYLAYYYSRALNYWGVELQRNNQLWQAADHFGKAIDVNPDNVVAQMNLDCNRNIQAGHKFGIEPTQAMKDRVARYRDIEQAMNFHGPFDEPAICFPQAEVLLNGGNYRQAAQLFSRVTALVPDNVIVRLRLAQACVLQQMPELALQVAAQIRAQPELVGLGRTNQTELLAVEATAHLAKNDLVGAQAAVENSLKQFPDDEDLLGTATRIYMTFGYYSNALINVDEQLRIRPDNPAALVNKGLSCLRLNAFKAAVPPLSRVVAMGTNNPPDIFYSALLNRAIANLRSDDLEAAQKDYGELQKGFPTAFQVSYGLGEIAYRKKDTNAALRNYQRYLSKAPTNLVEEINSVKARLAELKGSPR